MSSSLFDFDNPGPGGSLVDSLSAADDKTLRLAMHAFSEEELAGLQRFQETYLRHAELARDPEGLSTAHREALAACGLDARRVEQGLALLRLFCGKRWTAQRLRHKLQQLESAGLQQDEVRERIHGELDRLERETEDLGRRFGPQAVLMLRRHEPALLALHTRLTRVLSRG